MREHFRSRTSTMARQYIASIPAADYIREDIVRIDHSINSKYQLMGHYLHDAHGRSTSSAAVGRQQLSNCGNGDDQSVLHGGDQTDADLFAEPAERNRVPLQRQQDHA